MKNKVAPPFREAEFDIMFDEGISCVGDLLDLAVADDIVKKSGAWFSYGEIRLGQGRENSKVFLRENADLYGEVRQRVLKSRGVIADDGADPVADMAVPPGSSDGDDKADA